MSIHAPNDSVVFLGPTLPRATARQIFDALYLPPAQFGDVYRLIGRGIRRIVLIDGVFHARASVWPRELWEAASSGIEVYGAASMGALRAVELRELGMIGVGRIYERFASGELDGDDEVAILHADAEFGYRPLSEALVNLRENLARATAAGLIHTSEAAALVAALQQLPFWRRTLAALWSSAAFHSLAGAKQAALADFLREHGVDRKALDAIEALELVAASVAGGERPPPDFATRPPSAYLDRVRLLHRGFRVRGGVELDGRTIVDELVLDADGRDCVRWWLAAQLFVREWAQARALRVPADERDAALAALHERTPSDARLRENSLPEHERDTLLERLLLWTWLLRQPPERFGLSPMPDCLGAVLASRHPLVPDGELDRALPYVAAWCEQVHADPGLEARAALRRRWGPTLCTSTTTALWALAHGPVYFGYATWSLSTELLGALQIHDMIPELELP